MFSKVLLNEWINNEDKVEKSRKYLYKQNVSTVSSTHKEFRYKRLYTSALQPHTIYTDLNSNEL